MFSFKFRRLLAGFACAACLAASAFAENFNIPSGDLENALNSYVSQTGVHLIVSEDAIRGVHSRGVKGDLSPDEALIRILAGSGFVARNESGVMAVVRNGKSGDAGNLSELHTAAASTPSVSGAALETVTVTSSKIGGDVQNIPISITALSQEQLTSTQTAGGPDLIKQVPNMTFTKTNFSGYSIQLRGIGTQAISVTTDPAVAVAFNDIPFIRNHFFEQEFYDVSTVQVLRGPQGTLYGRNATAGVVNLASAKPTDQFEAMASADIGNFENRRLEGMINVPIIDDRLDLRVAGEWTKRNGYTFNETTGQSVDGRDLWSGRVTLGFKPVEGLEADIVWEHFSEDDDRMRSAKQLCKRDLGPSEVGPVNMAAGGFNPGDIVTGLDTSGHAVLSQGCLPVSLYSPEAFQTPNGQALPIVYAVEFGKGLNGTSLIPNLDPYASTAQPTNLRVIQSELTPSYKAKNDIVELNTSYAVTPALTFISNSGYNNDFLVSFEDFNRFTSRPGIFYTSPDQIGGGPDGTETGQGAPYTPGGILCDPQLGCSDRFVGEDLSQEHAWQISQEFRLASSFSGPFNFSVGANYLHYETLEDYYVFLNLITLESRFLDLTIPSTANEICLGLPERHVYPVLNQNNPLFNCPFTDGTKLTPGFDGQGHNYFRSENPYRLNSYAGFGEAYYQMLHDLKLTAGVRWTDDRKHFTEIPSEVLATNWGYPISGVIDQQWQQWTGRAVADWTPKFDFTDQTLIYASFSHGYKAGGANPPGPDIFASGIYSSGQSEINHPLTFKPEFVNAYEIGTKNTLLDGALTLNGDVFHYDYKAYQISEIVDRTSVNLNFDAKVNGAELESAWEPIPGLRFNFAGGWEDTSIAKGSQAIDLMDRTAGHTDWMVVKPSILSTSNCILPTYVIADLIVLARNSVIGTLPDGDAISSLTGAACEDAYSRGVDPVFYNYFNGTYFPILPPSGFDPATAPNGGAGFAKDLSGNKLPNAPPLTASFGAQYTIPLSSDWAGTLRGDYYWQDYSWARVFNDNPYDRLRGYTNMNLTLIFTNQSGWQAMAYMKNAFNTTAITGAFLNSDDTDLTTNVFVTDPRLIGLRITKNW